VRAESAARNRGSRRCVPLPVWRGPLVSLSELALASRAEPFSAPGWLFELKYDGFRVLAAKDKGTVTLRYRSGRDATRAFPEVVEALAALPARKALLDGERVVFRNGTPDFERFRQRALADDRRRTRDSASACLFDLLALDGNDLRQLPLVERKAMLRELLPAAGPLVYVQHVEREGERLLAGARELRLEGVVAKRADSAYAPGRTGSWLKFKVEETADFVVIGVADPSKETFGRASLVLATGTNHGLRYTGRAAIGRNELEALADVVP